MANINYEQTLIRMSRDVFMKVGGMYNATSYWKERNQIADYMTEKLNEELTTAYATCEGIQIIRVDLPKSYEDSIVSTQVEVQYTNMRKFEQQAQLIKQNIDVIRSQANQQIRVTNATANAEAYRIKEFAKAEALTKTIDTESDVYLNARKKIGIEGQDFTDYYYYTSLIENSNPSVLVGLQNSIINLGNNVNSISK